MSVLLSVHLAADVYPTMSCPAVSLEDELVEVAIHQNRKPFAELLNVLDVYIARLALYVLGRVAASYGTVQDWAAIAR